MTGLAVDWVGRNLYFIDGTQRSVKVVSLKNSSHVKTVVKDLHSLPTDVVVDPKNGVLYLALWSDVSPMRGEIFSGFMDGTGGKTFVNESIHWPIGLTVNYETNRLFWCDQHKQTIESVDFQGNHRNIFEIQATQPSALALITHSDFYVVSRTDGVIKHFKNDVLINTINKTSSEIFAIKLFEPRRNFTKNQPCNKCDNLCLLGANNSALCACADGFKYQHNECVVLRPVGVPCPPNHFRCRGDWTCKPDVLACDGKKDCSDGRDESTAPGGRCEHFECPKSSFQCDGTRCLPRSWVCDGEKDCDDGADEKAEKCMQTLCKDDEFQCSVTKKCVPKVWKCDLSHDCGPGDFSDEIDCGKLVFCHSL